MAEEACYKSFGEIGLAGDGGKGSGLVEGDSFGDTVAQDGMEADVVVVLLVS